MPDSPAPDAAFERARHRFMQGLASLQAQRHEEAEAHFTASLQDVPGRVSTLVNLAAARLARGRDAEALEAADAVLAAEPDNRDGWFHRGNALAGLGRLDEAARGFARAAAIDGGHAEIWLRHAQTLHALDRRDEALVSYRRCLALAPEHGGAWARCADILREQHRLDESADAFRQAIAHGADDELTRYSLAAVTPAAQGAPPARAPQAYVRQLFDGYAGDFEQHLVGLLGYQAHEVLVRQLRALAPRQAESALDLGCGTGLCGPLVRPWARRLVGVDLSAAMLEKARERQVYDELVQADVVEHLAAMPASYDVVLAADVLIYLGDLAPLFAALHGAMRPSALFGFTVELPTREGDDVALMPSLRCAHSEPYLRRVAAAHGFAVAGTLRAPLRRDQRVPIDGLYMTVRR